jgi:hypothetical protein
MHRRRSERSCQERRQRQPWQLAFLHSLSGIHPTAILFLIVTISYLLGICDILHLLQYLRTMVRPKDFDENARAELEALNATFVKVGGKGMSIKDFHRRRHLKHRERLSKLSPDAAAAKRSAKNSAAERYRKKRKATVDEKVCIKGRNVFSHPPYTIVTHTPLSHPQRSWPPTYDFSSICSTCVSIRDSRHHAYHGVISLSTTFCSAISMLSLDPLLLYYCRYKRQPPVLK